MVSDLLHVYLSVYSTRQNVEENEIWGHSLNPHLYDVCPGPWVFHFLYPSKRKRHASGCESEATVPTQIKFTLPISALSHDEILWHLYYLVQQLSQSSISTDVVCTPVSPEEIESEDIQISNIDFSHGSGNSDRAFQSMFCKVLFERLCEMEDSKLTPIADGWMFCSKISPIFLNRVDCLTTAATHLSLIPPRTIDSTRQAVQNCLRLYDANREIDVVERGLNILKSRQVEEAWIEDTVKLTLGEGVELHSIHSGFAAAIERLHIAVKAIHHGVNDRELDNILDNTTECLEQTSLLYRWSVDEEDRIKARSLAKKGCVGTFAGGATAYIGVRIGFGLVAGAGFAVACGGLLAVAWAGYLYYRNSNSFKDEVQRMIEPLHRIWFFARLLQARRQGLLDANDGLLLDFANFMERTYNIDVKQDWVDPEYTQSFLTLELKGLEPAICKIKTYVEKSDSWWARYT